MQLEIKTTIDAFNPNQVKALNDFLSAVGEHTAEKVEAIAEEKPKQTRKKAEKVDPTFYDLNNVEAPKTNFLAEAEQPQQETKAEAIEVVETETVRAPTLMQIRSLVAAKVAEHKDSIKAKLVELGAQNVSTLEAKHFQTIFDFLTEL